ncbi:probable ATP-dependent RNA helicase DHX35 [Aricia agestis]|uniref:probable ATP-dependent RNA helicase DHX35 n=1 Tax=Aricia agestis TaxID=91739 RepID=UPI001C204255|nr:probable ATP-dependent RNA helicase DHX35 [Aricia agestis]
MSEKRPMFVKPGENSLYPIKNKDGTVETLVNPNVESALSIDNDSKTSFVYNRYHHLPMSTQRQKLPVFQYRNHILYLLEKHQTLILIGETGCGKSTQVPQYLLEIGHRVCVTQPRVAATMTLAARVADERGERVGETVGFAAAMRSERSAETQLSFLTEGTLLREMFASPLLMQYTCIVLDEVHERSLMTDILMGLLKKIAKKRKHLKLVISSATMDAQFLREYFDLGGGTSVIMSMEGRVHPIDVFYAAEPVPDYVQATVETVIKIHENQPFGDILAFLTSQEEILSALETLNTYAEDNNDRNERRKHFPSGVGAVNMLVLPLYGTLPHYRQLKVFQSADGKTRKVVLATNIAETSVTIPGINYVIDCGFHKLAHYSVSAGVECVSVCPYSAQNATQRAGRAGRTARGQCYRLYTEEAYNQLPPLTAPEIRRADLSAALLQLRALGIENLLKFPFPTKPPAKHVLSALELLLALKAVDKTGGLTQRGEMMAELPVRPMCAAMLVNSGEYGCIDEILTIVSMLQVDGIFMKGSGKSAIEARVARRNNFEVAEGDILMYLNVYDSYAAVRDTRAAKEWCRRRYINHRVMEKAYEIRCSLEKLVKNKFKLEDAVFEGPDLGTGKTIRIMKAVLSGLFPAAARLTPSGYRGLRGAELYISGDSCLYHTQQPSWLVYASISTSSDRTLMRDLMVVQREWLLEVAPHYYRLT